jgi:hypothetical protein
MATLSDAYSEPPLNPWEEGNEYVRHERTPNPPGERVMSLLSSEEIIQIIVNHADFFFDSIAECKTKEQIHDAGIKYEEAVAILGSLGIKYDSKTGKKTVI